MPVITSESEIHADSNYRVISEKKSPSVIEGSERLDRKESIMTGQEIIDQGILSSLAHLVSPGVFLEYCVEELIG